MIYIINELELSEFYKNSENKRLNDIWKDVFSKMSANQQIEASHHKWTLLPHPEIKDSSFSKTFQIFIPDGSEELNQYLKHNAVISMITE